jgi:large subunit ribosomal protein L21
MGEHMKKVTEKKEYAIVETGGKQYIVAVGDQLKVEKMSDDVKVGDTLTLDKVLAIDNGTVAKVGTPYVTSSKVMAKVLDIAKDKKVQVIKYKQKSRYFVKQGHRQTLMKVEILSI